MTDNKKKVISRALQLDGSADSIRQYYADWAENYEVDVGEAYRGPAQTVKTFLDALATQGPGVTADMVDQRIADVGCGTGLVAVELSRIGFRCIDGFDLSKEMVDEARTLQIYRNLDDNFDLTKPLPERCHEQYDAALCCGVFTSGHVPPEGLYNLLGMVRSGGIVVCSTRSSYYDQSGFEEVSVAITKENIASVVVSDMNMAYTSDEDAHYWAYQKIS